MPYSLISLPGALPAIISTMPDTPRIALALSMRGGSAREIIPGVAKLAGRLLLKGTEKRTAEQLALELDEHAIDLHESTYLDNQFLSVKFLPREFTRVLEIISDIIFNTTFADIKREKELMLGEITASFDMPAEIARDLLLRTLFADHPYGHSGSKILEALPYAEISPALLRDWFDAGLNSTEMNVCAVGDFNAEEITAQLIDTFSPLQQKAAINIPADFTLNISSDRLVTQAKNDAQQAQIQQAWAAPPLGDKQQAALTVMNTIFGSAGLSSRLFTELRDKQGLAYTVRSQYAGMKQCGLFSISIGTSPGNITKARTGFIEQLTRLQQEPVSDEELANAKGRLRGTMILGQETTSQICQEMAMNHINGLGVEYSQQLLVEIDAVSSDDVQRVAQLFESPSITAIVAPEEYLPKE